METSNLFASAQCLGYNNEHGTLSYDLCYPSEKKIIKQVSDHYTKLLINEL
jgi:hypothetical protein